MIPPVEIADRSDYKERLNALLTIDPARTVLLTIDMQRDYLDLSIATKPTAADDAERVLSHAGDLLDFARAEGIPVIHVYVQRRPAELAQGLYLGGSRFAQAAEALKRADPARAAAPAIPDRLEGSPHAEVPAALVRPGDVHVTTKKTTDAYLETDLGLLLARVYRPEVVLLTGINTDTCVYATTMSTCTRGYKPVVVSDCVASTRGKDHHWMALELMSRTMAWVLTVDQVKAKVRSARSGPPVS